MVKQTRKRFELSELRQTKDSPITLKVNGATYDKFQKNMKKQKLFVSDVFNQFMIVTNDLLENEGHGEVVFVFEEAESEKKEGGKKKA